MSTQAGIGVTTFLLIPARNAKKLDEGVEIYPTTWLMAFSAWGVGLAAAGNNRETAEDLDSKEVEAEVLDPGDREQQGVQERRNPAIYKVSKYG